MVRIGRFNIGRKTAPRITPEEEEDRARSLLTRRKFLFMGAAAAGAVALKPLMPLAPKETTMTTYLVGADALIIRDIGKEMAYRSSLTMESILSTYYSKTFLENIRANTPRLLLTRNYSVMADVSDWDLFGRFNIGRSGGEG